MFSIVVYLRLLLVLFVAPTDAFDSVIYPKSASFHHVLQWIHGHARWTNQSSVTLPTLLPSVVNGTACANDLLRLVESLSRGEQWASKTVDAWGTKPPAGILEGSHLWLGSYDECLHRLYLPLNRTYALQPYSTKYCTAAHWTGSEDEDIVIFQKPLLIVGLCLPQSCEENDFQSNFFSVRCASDHRSMSTGTIFIICLILFLVLFINLAAWIPPLQEYSARFTLTRLFALRHSTNSDFQFLNGIRIVSLLWIILGHSFVFQLSMSDNIVHILDAIHNSLLMRLLFGAIFAVDTFFFISGFLFVLVFLHKFNSFEKFRFTDILFYYLHRYCRLLPTLAFVLVLSIHLSPWMGYGPLFPTKTGFEVPQCHQQWWTTLLFVNNFVDPTRSCLAVTWYLANDFQYHLLAPFLLIPWLLNRRRLTYFLLVCLLLAHIVTVLIIVITHPGFETGFEKDDGPSLDFFEKVYITPWCRVGPFLIGMITKLILEDYPCALSTLKKMLGTSLSLVLALLCIFLPFYSDSFPRWFLILYQSMCRSCWAIAIAWLIILCTKDQASRLTRFLSWSVWTILARLSYAAYLIHATIILAEVYNRYSVLHYQVGVLFSGFLGQILFTFLASIGVILLVESPCSTLLKHIRHYFKTEPLSFRVNRSTYGTIG